MNFKMNLVALAALVAAGAAHAELKLGDFSNTSDLGSSVLFVAQDNAGTKGSYSADLGRLMADLLPTGALNAGNTTATWNLATNAVTVNGVAQSGGFQYSAQWTSFQTLLAGSSYQWGVFAADSNYVAGTATDGYNLLFTTSVANRSFSVSDDAIFNSPGNVDQYISTNQGLGTHQAGVNGAATVSNSGTQYLGTTLAANGEGSLGPAGLGGNNFLNNVNSAAVVMRTQFDSVNNVTTTYQLGLAGQSVAGIVDGTEATFTFDGTTLTYQVSAVPEPQTYAMLLAGLAAVGFVARRRRAAR